MPTEPRNHASKEESPLTEITHTKPLNPFLTSLKPSEPIAPVEETTKAEAKVLIQPTQEATIDVSAPRTLPLFDHLFIFCIYILV